MENLGSCLQYCLKLRSALECGESVRMGLKVYSTNKFDQLVREWLFVYDQKKDINAFYKDFGAFERAFFEIVRSGLDGNRIYDRLVEFESELFQRCLAEIQKEIDALPLKLMIPVLFFQFPAYLILILGPVMGELLKNLGGN